MRHVINILRVLSNPRIVFEPIRQYRKSAKHGLKSTLYQRLKALEFLRRWLRRERLVRHRGRWVINAFLPPFPGDAFDRQFENLLPGKQLIPLSAFVAITSDCPADCWHCSLKNRRPGKPLSREQWLDVIAQLNQIGTAIIGLTGGEPLTQEYLPELVRAANQGGAEVELFTSGIGLTQAKCDALRKAGLWAVGVSLDHTKADIVDRKRRTPKAFEAAIAALKMAQQTGFYTFVNAVPDRETVISGEYQRLYELAKRLKIHELRLIEPMPCGQLMNDGHDCLLRREEVDVLRRFHRTINRRGRGPKVCAFNEIESPQMFGCVAGFQHLFVDPTGEVCPCDFTPLSFGNVQDEPLANIWQRMTDAMRQPRRNCFIQTNAALIRRYAEGHGFPLPTEVSLRILAESPEEPLPDYFQQATKPFGFPR